ncbi:MAG: hypothetical protein IPM55_15010 [Acidobacteria bacterium]|nr:hypothetical protein [Acidobacteriota bacterium]
MPDRPSTLEPTPARCLPHCPIVILRGAVFEPGARIIKEVGLCHKINGLYPNSVAALFLISLPIIVKIWKVEAKQLFKCDAQVYTTLANYFRIMYFHIAEGSKVYIMKLEILFRSMKQVIYDHLHKPFVNLACNQT